MKPGGGQRKGKQFEKLVAKMVGNWWCNDETAFWRSCGSGGRLKYSDVYSGDITPDTYIGKWMLSIECKNENVYYDIISHLAGKKSESRIADYFAQCYSDAKNSKNPIPILIFTRNYDGLYVGVNTHFFRYFRLKLKKYNWIKLSIRDVHANIQKKYPDITSIVGYILPVEALFNTVTRKDIVKYYKKFY